MKRIHIILLVAILTSCGFGAGTHSSIKSYEYPVTKSALDNAVMNVLQNKTNVYRDTIRNFMIDVTNGKNDTIDSNYYNDGKTYLTIHIKTADNMYDYTFRYAGDSLSWVNSTTSVISICYIYDGKGDGGSEGNGIWDQTNNEIKTKMIDLFETEFVKKIDHQLNTKHISIN